MTTRLSRVTASAEVVRLTATLGGGVTASAQTRTLTGDVVEFGVYGRTSAGRLRVRPGALRFPEDLGRVKLTREHDRDDSRGHLVNLIETPERITASLRVDDGPKGDEALSWATPPNRTRDALSFDAVDVRIEGDEITYGEVVAIGQVAIPAFTNSRITQVAASQTQQGTTHQGDSMTPEQRERLAALLAKKRDDLTADEMREVIDLQALAAEHPEATADQAGQESAEQQTATVPAQRTAPATERVAASMPAVPGGTPRPATRTEAADPITDFIRAMQDAHREQRVTAALADVTFTAHSGNVVAPGWSGELWSGVSYDPIFTPLLNSGDLTGPKGVGWRWVVKPELQDYAGDKAAVPTNTLDTETAEYTAARMAVGHDFDRAYYDFPEYSTNFLRSYLAAIPESWAVKLDAKVEAWILANDVPATLGGVAVVSQSSIFRAVAKGLRSLRRNLAGKGTFVILSDNDYDSLMDVTELEVPKFLAMFGVTPESFIPSAGQANGTVTVGVKQSASVLTLPGSPIRASAQHIANGGIDEAFFGYWAVQQHHETGIVTVPWAAV